MEQDVDPTHAARLDISRVLWPHVNLEKTVDKAFYLANGGLIPSVSAILGFKRAIYYKKIKMFSAQNTFDDFKHASLRGTILH